MHVLAMDIHHSHTSPHILNSLCVGVLGPNLEQRLGEGKTQRKQKTQETQPATGWWGVFIPGCCGQTGQTGPGDRSDRSGLQQPAVHPRSTAELLSSTRSLCCDAATSTKYRSAVLEGPRNPGRWPVLRKPPKPHAREDSRLHAVALDVVPASAF